MNSSAQADRSGFDSGRLGRIQNWMLRYVETRKLPFAAAVIARHGDVVWRGHAGDRDVEAGLPYQPDTIVRIYSMTKPVTSIGLMMLFEQGLFNLDDPIEDYLPEFSDLNVLRDGAKNLDEVEPATTKPTIHHLLTHTAGLTYGFQDGMMGQIYRDRDVDFDPAGDGLAATTRRLATLPLLFQPGEKWHYSVSCDVLGRLIEVISGKSLDLYIRDQILEPLEMKDTGFDVPDEKLDRLANLYVPDSQRGMALHETAQDSMFRAGRVKSLSGGGGLLSTAGDYMIFADMLRRGGVSGHARLVSPRTLKFMASNHLPGDLASMGPKTWCETSCEGVGFGLGFSVTLDPVTAHMLGSPGDYGWGGVASTVFWVDPLEDMVVLFLTQLMPSSTYPIRKELRTLVYQALVD